MKLLRTIEKVTHNPWVITPAGYAAVKQLIDSKLAGAQVDVAREDFKGTNTDVSLDRKHIASVTISGTLGQRLSWLEVVCGGCDYLDVTRAVGEALDDGADGFLFTFDSPGGMAIGCAECAEVIAAVPVPKVAFTDSLMCSGAYWLASGCDWMVAAPSADVGSIGVIIPWIDQSKLWDELGLKFEPITSKGDTLKSTMYGPELTEEQKAYLQDDVDQTAAAFRGHVSKYRDLDFTALRAGAYSGARALELNLIDQIGTQAEAYNELLVRIQKAA
jgi:signal peptide peptidase SppA